MRQKTWRGFYRAYLSDVSKLNGGTVTPDSRFWMPGSDRPPLIKYALVKRGRSDCSEYLLTQGNEQCYRLNVRMEGFSSAILTLRNPFSGTSSQECTIGQPQNSDILDIHYSHLLSLINPSLQVAM